MKERPLVCPRCGIRMRKIKKKAVIIDVCDSCHGMWLDDREIDRLLKGVKNEKE
jgi:hypothetical protein